MIGRLGILLRRDLGLLLLGGRRGGTVLPLLFFLAVAMLFPFAVGPDAPLLARTGGGVIWVAALLAAILPLDRLVEPDIELGFFDQWALRGISEEWIVAVRMGLPLTSDGSRPTPHAPSDPRLRPARRWRVRASPGPGGSAAERWPRVRSR